MPSYYYYHHIFTCHANAIVLFLLYQTQTQTQTFSWSQSSSRIFTACNAYTIPTPITIPVHMNKRSSFSSSSFSSRRRPRSTKPFTFFPTNHNHHVNVNVNVNMNIPTITVPTTNNGYLYSFNQHRRHRHKKNLLILQSSQSQIQSTEYDEWQPNNLQSDMHNLRNAVSQSNADADLAQSERIHLLHEFALQRRELAPDGIKFIGMPLAWAFCCILLYSNCRSFSSTTMSMSLSGNRHHRRGLNFLSFIVGMRMVMGMVINNACQFLFHAMNAFYLVSIIVPIVTYHFIPSMVDSSPTGLSLTTDDNTDDDTDTQRQSGTNNNNNILCTGTIGSDASRNDCADYSKCILESWVSAIYPSALMNVLTMATMILPIILCRQQKTPVQVPPIIRTLTLGMHVSRFITRLGAAASLYQFPKLLYDLRRGNQPRPIAFIPTMLNKMVNVYLLMLPFGFASDVAQLVLHFTSAAGAGTGGYSYTSYNGGLTTPLLDHNTVLLHPYHDVYRRVAKSLLFISIITPLSHLIALKRIVRIGKFSNVSLGMDQTKALELINEEEKNGFKLRYRLQWRPPMRVLHSTKRLFRRFVLYFFTGWGEKASIVDDSVASPTDEPYILTLVGREMQQQRNGNNQYYSLSRRRADWIQDASERMAKIHQSNYRNKTFNDPLGIAFHQTFGIGLSFDFDHDSKLRIGEVASIHRLRARAAKSAIKSYNAIPQKVELQVQSIEDEEERGAMYDKLVQLKRKEIQNIAREIARLFSSNAASPEGKDLDVFSMKLSEANKLDPVTLPWLKNPDDEESDDDPYLSFDDAFVRDWRLIGDTNDDGDDDIFNRSKQVLT